MVEIVITVFSILGSILLVFGFAPQAIKTYKTKNTQHLSWLMWVLIDIACVFFIIYGVSFIGKFTEEGNVLGNLVPGLSLVLSNLFVCIASLVVTYYKFKHMFKAKKANCSEEEIVNLELSKKRGENV